MLKEKEIEIHIYAWLSKGAFKKIVFILKHEKITTLLPKGTFKKMDFILGYGKITTLQTKGA